MKLFFTLKFTTVAFVSGIVLGGCEKDYTAPEGIIGEWRWIESLIPATGFVLSPEMAGYSITLEFDDLYYYRYEDDSLTNKRQYDLVISDTLIYGESQFLELDAFLAYSMELTPDELKLKEFQLNHGYIHTYHRVR